MPVPLEASIRDGARAAAHDLHVMIRHRKIRRCLLLKRLPNLTPDVIQDVIMRAMHKAKDY